MEISDFISKCNEYFQSYIPSGARIPEGHKAVYSLARKKIGDPRLVLKATTYIRQKLVIMCYQQGFDYKKYIPVLDSIRDAARYNLSKEAPTETDWGGLLKVIIENRRQISSFDGYGSSSLDEKFDTFAWAYLRLTNYGVEFTEMDYSIYISERSFGFIQSEIERLCMAYGGNKLLVDIVHRLGKTFNNRSGRFMEYRHVSMGITSVQAALPLGYLFALGVKYTGSKGLGEERYFNHLLALISDIIITFEIQPYFQFEAMHLDADVMIEFIKKNLLYDSLVGLPQIKASCASDLIKFLLSRFSGASYSSYGISLRDVARVGLALISLSRTKQLTTVSTRDISIKAGVAEFKVSEVMERILSFNSGMVNADLEFPPSSLTINYYFKPAIKSGKRYRILPKSIASLGSLNSVCDCISRPDGKWSNPKDSGLGYAIEDFLRGKINSKGLQMVYGERVGGEVHFEADLICETEERIYIFEMKKKGLTRQALSGDELHIFSDLAKSVLATHVQAMRIEKALKSGEIITLAHDGVEQTISLNGRSVTRISVSLHDFGALQDKIVMQRILNIAISSEVSHADVNVDKFLKEWREYSIELRRLARENGESEVEGAHPFHDSLFMSVPQIVMVLDNSEGADDFFKNIRSFVCMGTGSRDTYTEFLNRLRLTEQCKAEGISI
ncbi:hypothetical protein HX882_33655 [Pseudomonas gingeri]|uniref:NERD domain-containing protein n=1 Tax=Pseudomonas gingeri TaxID=117681 RepID=A0A7Y7XJV2_9PSED|nr:hypothetical protein [Pseudomonas gingeri]NWC00822.1 hypothetical protein [Pseudomonas gingeri]